MTASRFTPFQSSATLSLSQLLEMTGGELLPLTVGDSANCELAFSGAAPPAEAVAGEITMVDHAQHAAAIVGSAADLVLTPAPLAAEVIDEQGPRWQVITADPHAAFTSVISHFRPPLGQEVTGTGVDATACIDPSAQISPAASIGAGVTIGPDCKIHAGVTIAAGCHIGAQCVLYPNVTLYTYCRLGERVVIHAGSTLGAHGFGYRNVEGRHIPTEQLGYVQVDDDVELGASVTIDRGTYGATRIGEGTKIDNQVMIGHNCRIGKHNLLCSQVGVAGSCSTGDYVVLAGQVGLKDHIHLSDGVVVAAQAGVMEDLAKGVYLGSPATAQQDQLRMLAVQRKLPELRREVRRLQNEMKILVKRSELSSDDRSSDRSSSKAA